MTAKADEVWAAVGKTCSVCGETSPALEWEGCGPTGWYERCPRPQCGGVCHPGVVLPVHGEAS